MNDTEAKSNWITQNNLNQIPKACTQWGSEVKVLYTPADVFGINYTEDIGMPGEYPFTRGIHPAMYRAQPWKMGLYSGYGCAEETNARWKYLLEQGANSVAWAFDVPTQLGMDSDNPLAKGEVGRTGLAIDTLKDLEVVYEGLPVDRMITNMVISGPAPTLIAMYVALAEKKGIPVSSLRGTINNDIFAEFMAVGNWIFPPEPSLRLTGDVIEYCTRYLPKFSPITVRGYTVGEVGANPAEEMAFVFSAAFACLENVLARGMDVDEVAPKFNFLLRWNTHFLEEAAKVRATRRLWARILKEKYGTKKRDSMAIRISGNVAGSLFRAQEPENNLIRGAYALLGGVLGGAQGHTQAAMDEAYSIPTEKAAKLALRTQQICAYETGVMDTVDPLAGSYYVEALTNQIEADIRKILKEIQDMGGIVEAIKTGYTRNRCSRNSTQLMKEEESGERVVVGVNRFQSEERRRPIEILRVSPEIAIKQVERLKAVKASRDNEAVDRALEQLRKAAMGNENTLPATIEAVKVYATLGEITDTLKSVFGVFQEPVYSF